MNQPLKVQRFIEEYLVDFNATKAAIRAGYSKRSARQVGSRLLTNDDIRKTVETRKKELADACDVTREELVRTTREVIARCRMTGRKFRPDTVLRANRFLADLTGLIVVRTAIVNPEPARELDFGDLPIPNQPRAAGKPN